MDNGGGTKIYAVNGWKDIDVQYTGNYGASHGGKMFCGEGYTQKCDIAKNGWTCSSYTDYCNFNSISPTKQPSVSPSNKPTISPTNPPSTKRPSTSPSNKPTISPTNPPSTHPSSFPTNSPSIHPSLFPTKFPTRNPTSIPTFSPTKTPSIPSISPTKSPTRDPTPQPTNRPTWNPVQISNSNPNPSPSPSESGLVPSPQTNVTGSGTNGNIPNVNLFNPTIESPTISPSNIPTPMPSTAPILPLTAPEVDQPQAPGYAAVDDVRDKNGNVIWSNEAQFVLFAGLLTFCIGFACCCALKKGVCCRNKEYKARTRARRNAIAVSNHMNVISLSPPNHPRYTVESLEREDTITTTMDNEDSIQCRIYEPDDELDEEHEAHIPIQRLTMSLPPAGIEMSNKIGYAEEKLSLKSPSKEGLLIETPVNDHVHPNDGTPTIGALPVGDPEIDELYGPPTVLIDACGPPSVTLNAGSPRALIPSKVSISRRSMKNQNVNKAPKPSISSFDGHQQTDSQMTSLMLNRKSITMEQSSDSKENDHDEDPGQDPSQKKYIQRVDISIRLEDGTDEDEYSTETSDDETTYQTRGHRGGRSGILVTRHRKEESFVDDSEDSTITSSLFGLPQQKPMFSKIVYFK